MKTYSYQILRFRSSPTSDEFVNLGVCVQEGNIGRIAFKRAKAIQKLYYHLDETNLANIETYLRWVDNDFDELDTEPNLELSLASQKVLPTENTRLYFSEVRTCLGFSLKERLENLYKTYIP